MALVTDLELPELDYFGPDLKGVSKRFALRDLFTAIVQPSKEVPGRYQLTQVETRSGKVYEGVVIYDAVDSLILQIGAASTARRNILSASA
jgi:hypothetical protein